MRAKRCVVIGVWGFWTILLGARSPLIWAQNEEPPATHEHQEHQTPAAEGAPMTEPHHDMENMAPEEHAGGHHHHRPAILPPDEDKAYSELNHHIAGVFVLFAGGLALLAAVGGQRFAWARYGWPGLFFLLGVFLFIRHDPESWPFGPLTFWESVTEAQVLQHMLFTLIALAIGAIEWMRCRGTLAHPAWGWIFPSLAVSAAIMLFMHKHGEGAAADKIYRHHSIMATSGIVAMIAKVFDDSRLSDSKVGSYVWTGLITFVGFMLLIYSE